MASVRQAPCPYHPYPCQGRHSSPVAASVRSSHPSGDRHSYHLRYRRPCAHQRPAPCPGSGIRALRFHLLPYVDHPPERGRSHCQRANGCGHSGAGPPGRRRARQVDVSAKDETCWACVDRRRDRAGWRRHDRHDRHDHHDPCDFLPDRAATRARLHTYRVRRGHIARHGCHDHCDHCDHCACRGRRSSRVNRRRRQALRLNRRRRRDIRRWGPAQAPQLIRHTPVRRGVARDSRGRHDPRGSSGRRRPRVGVWDQADHARGQRDHWNRRRSLRRRRSGPAHPADQRDQRRPLIRADAAPGDAQADRRIHRNRRRVARHNSGTPPLLAAPAPHIASTVPRVRLSGYRPCLSRSSAPVLLIICSSYVDSS